MITIEMVKKGYEKGIIQIVKSPHKDGVVCQIGEFWFYFGGLTAEEYSLPDKYKKAIPKETIIQEIYDLLNSFSKQKEFIDEYNYYESILIENNITEEMHTTEQAALHLQHLRDELIIKNNMKNIWCLDTAINFLKVEEKVNELMKNNEENFKHLQPEDKHLYAAGYADYNKGYAEGVHDGLLSVLKSLKIKTEEEYYKS